jgi:hypothetical protein
MIMDFASKEDGGKNMGFKIGANAIFPVGESGFAIIPGVMYTNILKINDEDAKTSNFDFGLTLQYAF